MAEDNQLINVNINVVDRSFGLTIRKEEEAVVREAAKLINERVANLRKKYQAQGQRDYLGMALLLITVDYLKTKQQHESMTDVEGMLHNLDEKLLNFFEGV